MTLIKCPCCEGEGKTPMPQHLEETLSAIPRRGTICAERVAEKLKLHSPNAASNRLMDLLMLDLVKRERDGKFWLYSRK